MKNAEKIKSDGKNRDFDCIIGLSGGLDSSYCAYIVKSNVTSMLFHVDAGWNTDQAVSNIEKIVDGLGLDLYNQVQLVKQIFKCFLRSQVQRYSRRNFFNSLSFARKNKTICHLPVEISVKSTRQKRKFIRC